MICPECGTQFGCASSDNLRVLCHECFNRTETAARLRFLSREQTDIGTTPTYDVKAWEKLNRGKG